MIASNKTLVTCKFDGAGLQYFIVNKEMINHFLNQKF